MAGRVGRDEMEAAVGTYSEGDGGKRWSGSGCRRTMAADRGGTVPDMQPTKGAVEPSCCLH